MATTYTLISSNVLSGSAASVTFSSIPSTYTDLVLRISARSDFANNYVNIGLKINNDATAIYSYTYIRGDGSSAASSFNFDTTPELDIPYSGVGSSNTANTFSNQEIYIPNYNSTIAKQFSSFSEVENNAATGYNTAHAILYRGTSAITRLDLNAGTSSNFVSGSSFYLYGIKKN